MCDRSVGASQSGKLDCIIVGKNDKIAALRVNRIEFMIIPMVHDGRRETRTERRVGIIDRKKRMGFE